MSFLTINNYQIPVSSESASNSPIKGQNENRSINGDLVSTRTYEKESFSVTTPVLHPNRAKVIRGLIEGYGHNFSYDNDLYSDGKGLSTSDFSSLTLVASGGKFGGYLQIDAGGYAEYDLSRAISNVYNYDEWTVIAWVDFDNLAGTKQYYFANPAQPAVIDYSADYVFNHYIISSSGNTYQNGVLVDFDIDFLNVTNKLFRIEDLSSEKDYNIDDLIILPFEIDYEINNEVQYDMINAFYNLGSDFSDLPFLKVNGDITDNVELNMKGKVESYDYQGYSSSGDFIKNGKVLEITLIER